LRGGLLVKPTPLAAAQIQKEARCWRTHRTKAPKLLPDELRRAFDLISDHPEVGAVAADTELFGVRRVLLAETQHYLYYRVDEGKGRIEVLAFWSTSRGADPDL
jgi:Plasmid stabilisation system protein.